MNSPLPNHRSEPHWHPAGHFRQGELPPAVAHWLVDRGSLTARLKRGCAGRFGVRVLRQGRGRPQLEEAHALAVKPGASALVREVLLTCDGAPQVFARTVIPDATLGGKRRRLAHLGERPLGEFLFRQRGMERDELELTRLTARHALFGLATAELRDPPPEIWGRRSLFRLDHHPLLVAEFFLPAIAD
ncbi:chorismate--pyruvate lyase family protein [Endothiovibrio diazotrophicus]